MACEVWLTHSNVHNLQTSPLWVISCSYSILPCFPLSGIFPCSSSSSRELWISGYIRGCSCYMPLLSGCSVQAHGVEGPWTKLSNHGPRKSAELSFYGSCDKDMKHTVDYGCPIAFVECSSHLRNCRHHKVSFCIWGCFGFLHMLHMFDTWVLFKVGSYSVAKGSLEFTGILLPLSLQVWEYRHEPPCPAKKYILNNWRKNKEALHVLSRALDRESLRP